MNGVISGEYTYDNGVIQQVQVNGYVLTGEWVETPSTGDKMVGRFSWTFDEFYSHLPAHGGMLNQLLMGGTGKDH